MLPELLRNVTALPVVEAGNGVRVLPNHIYVSMPGSYLSILRGVLHVMRPEPNQTIHLPIDYFLRALAADQKEKALCIVLSGTGTDGTLGLREIKANLGMTLVQAVTSAKFGGMPASAIATGLADFVLLPEDMPRELFAWSSRPFAITARERANAEATEAEEKVFLLIRERTGYDFSGYKIGTIRRRIAYRMGLHEIPDQESYVHFLQSNSQEINLLFRDLLIGVTGFFRDPEAFDALALSLESLIETRPDNYTLRVWIPACATGEEAYSLAILLRETLDTLNRSIHVQIFATDLDREAVEFARKGSYPEGIAKDVSTHRLNRYFTREGGTYRVRQEIRELIVFAVQNATSDPPFTRMDLICCRNLFIYLDRRLQKHLLSLFHYALKDGGLLFLGLSERVDRFIDLFEAVDKFWKIYRRKENTRSHHSLPELYSGAWRPSQKGNGAKANPTSGEVSLPRSVELLLLSRFAPTSIVVDKLGDAVYFYGHAGVWFEPAAGRARLNVLDMAREGLNPDLSAALLQAAGQNKAVSRERVRVRTDRDYELLDLNVSPISEPGSLEGLFLVTFRPSPPVAETAGSPPHHSGQTATARNAGMERELKSARESLKTTIEALAASNEELRATNDELHTTNEELGASREETQSQNEELATLNAQLQRKVDELARASDDLRNLLNGIHIAIIFLDRELKIARYTEQARTLVNLIETDIGRPLADLTSNLNYEGITADCREVLRTLVYKQVEVQTKQGQWFFLRIAPYLTAEHEVDGLVLTFFEAASARLAEKRLQRISGMFSVSPDPIVIVDLNDRIADVNVQTLRSYGWAREELLGRKVTMMVPEARREVFTNLLERCRNGETISDAESLWVDRPGREMRTAAMMLPLADEHGRPEAIALVVRLMVQP